MRPLLRLLFVILFPTFVGCGTINNLEAPPPPGPPSFGIPTSCFPLGGIARTGLLAVAGPQLGVGWILEGRILEGGGLFGLGVLAWVDIPFSLVGDVVTLPLAYARSKGEPCATWWGKQEVMVRRPTATDTPPATDEIPSMPEQASSGEP
jgi:uncharacterized protein YceK